MGTNFYIPENHPKAEGMTEEERHVGKRSMGWNFLFQGHPHIKTVDAWKAELNKYGQVEDEYGGLIPLDEFWEMALSWKGKSHLDLNDGLGWLTSEAYGLDGDVEFCYREFE